MIGLFISLVMLPFRLLTAFLYLLTSLVNAASHGGRRTRSRSTSRQRSSSGQRHPGAAAAGSVGPSAHLWWALSPAYTCGFAAFIPSLHAAIKLRRRNLWYFAAALLVGDVIAWILLSSSSSNADGSYTPTQNVGGVLGIVLAVVGTVQALRIREAVFAESDAAVENTVAAASVGHDAAIASALAARQRRAESVALTVKDPSLARDLMIGRPDLPREYDDGGLVDVNHVPKSILVSSLGFSTDQAQAVIDARDHVGGFVSSDDMSNLANLPPRMVDAIQDRIVTL